MIAYVVACWFGNRRIMEEEYLLDRSDYIKWQIKKLTELKTKHISEIIFVLNDMDYAVSIPSEINGIPVVVMRRENIGMSYGAWDFAYQQNLDRFDYYFFIEDDYVPTIDNFDQIFLDKFRYNTGFVCSLYDRGHAAISNGLMRVEALRAVGGVIYPTVNAYGLVEQVGQVGMSKNLEVLEFGVEHIADDYSVPFLTLPCNVIYYGNPEGPRVISPVYLERKMYAK